MKIHPLKILLIDLSGKCIGRVKCELWNNFNESDPPLMIKWQGRVFIKQAPKYNTGRPMLFYSEVTSIKEIWASDIE